MDTVPCPKFISSIKWSQKKCSWNWFFHTCMGRKFCTTCSCTINIITKHTEVLLWRTLEKIWVCMFFFISILFILQKLLFEESQVSVNLIYCDAKRSSSTGKTKKKFSKNICFFVSSLNVVEILLTEIKNIASPASTIFKFHVQRYLQFL